MLAFENYLSLVSQMYFKSSLVLTDFLSEQEQREGGKREAGRPGRKSKKVVVEENEEVIEEP